jgi:hypothetical protein
VLFDVVEGCLGDALTLIGAGVVVCKVLLRCHDSERFIAVVVGLTFKSLAVSLRTARFNIKKFYVVLALCWVFCVDLRTGSDFALYVIN